MKFKLITLAILGMLAFANVACTDEEVVPAQEVVLDDQSTCECEGGIEEREIRFLK